MIHVNGALECRESHEVIQTGARALQLKGHEHTVRIARVV